MNKFLALTRTVIPYVKELKQLDGIKTISTCILMQQLEYWFDKMQGRSFYKFLSPCNSNVLYREQESWTEELGISEDEFRTCFDQIGTRYKSKALFDEVKDDPFKGKFYASYYDRIKGLTYYLRNNHVVDSVLDNLINGKDNAPSGLSKDPETGQTDHHDLVNLPTLTKPVYGNWPSQDLPYTDTTTENTTENTEPTFSKPENRRPYQKPVNLERELPAAARNILGFCDNPKWYKAEFKQLAVRFDTHKVRDVFENWVESNKSHIRDPLKEFMKVVDSLVRDGITRDNPALITLAAKLYAVGEQAFAGRNLAALNTLLQNHAPEEVLSAYKEFIENKDEISIKWAPRDFVEGVAQAIILTRRQRLLESNNLEMQAQRAEEKARVQVEETLRQLEEAEKAEQKLIEEDKFFEEGL
jgi:hypothetical protein